MTQKMPCRVCAAGYILPEGYRTGAVVLLAGYAERVCNTFEPHDRQP